ncbi:hypothetical protein NL676_035341 [Syzygium grande]|nr:hypothetical protein NL676_035341 [Syzygium grande]
MGQYLHPFFFKREASQHALYYAGLKLEPSGLCFQSEERKQSALLLHSAMMSILKKIPRSGSVPPPAGETLSLLLFVGGICQRK